MLTPFERLVLCNLRYTVILYQWPHFRYPINSRTVIRSFSPQRLLQHKKSSRQTEYKIIEFFISYPFYLYIVCEGFLEDSASKIFFIFYFIIFFLFLFSGRHPTRFGVTLKRIFSAIR